MTRDSLICVNDELPDDLDLTIPDDLSALEGLGEEPQGPTPLALVHGIGSTPIDWQDVVSRIGATRPMAAPWVSGLKPTEAVGLDLPRCAEGVLNTPDVMTWRRFDAVGVDVGGLVCATLAVNHPQKVRRLVLSAVFPQMPKMAVRMQKLALQAQSRNNLVAQGIDRQRTLEVLDVLAGLDATETLRALDLPVLVLSGEDRTARAAAQQVAALVPGAELGVVPGGGRRPHLEAPEAFADAVVEFTADDRLEEGPGEEA
ncbi:Pimeloyl-ACP methyl ester carboxylesterase [Kytococcus aerolatus]|uniref:Pimeloyl-ACP methyl ester carboxylesterase n=1 Tax=Kytococcus aerolatus TaxID=592308 RepID=A0A212U5P4_9MICO|nr:Pimeloyl-ACP methyl ester carboxylesterase [Kytococcus aerolatus]